VEKSMEENMILISQSEYARLCRLDGRVGAAKDYVENNIYATTQQVLKILGLEVNNEEE
jgi:hypothetical protein